MGLTPQQWETVKELFETAVEKPAADRALFLAGASQDAVVVHEVERLLANHTEAGTFLSSPPLAAVAMATAVAAAQSFSPGDLLADHFPITRFIARDGMGEVYEAAESLVSAWHSNPSARNFCATHMPWIGLGAKFIWPRK